MTRLFFNEYFERKQERLAERQDENLFTLEKTDVNNFEFISVSEHLEKIQKRDELLNAALKHLDMAYKWGLWLYESEDYQEMEDDDEKDNMGSDLDIVCSFLNTNKGSER